MIDLDKYKGYVQSETPNKELIADIVQEIKGNRNSVTYSSDIGLSPIKISRIFNCNYANALDIDTLFKLADGNEAFLDRLISANGMISPKDQEERKEIIYIKDRSSLYAAMEKKAHFIIMSELLSRGVSLKNVETHDLPLYDGNIMTTIRYDSAFVVTDKDGNSTNWLFEICPPFIGDKDESSRTHRLGPHMKRYFSSEFSVFLADAWQPERLKGCKYSFVLFDEWVMDEMEQLIVKDKLNNWFSIVLVNLDESKIVKEVVLKGDDDMHVFDWNVIYTHKKNSSLDEFDMEGVNM